MSNFLSIAAVTAAIKEYLTPHVSAAVPGVDVSTLRPNDFNSGNNNARLNIYMYQSSPNTAFRNDDLPTRNRGGGYVARPRAALNLDYIFSFYGDESELEAQRMLGSVVSALHARPIIGRELIQNAIDTITQGDPDHYLADSNLADQAESIKFTQLLLNLEELSKLWSVFFQTSYSLSVAYRCSVVFLEAPVTPTAGLPVSDIQSTLGPAVPPAVETPAIQPSIVGTTFEELEFNTDGTIDIDIIVEMNPPLEPSQHALLLLNGVIGGENASFSIPAPPRSEAQTFVRFPAKHILQAEYFIRTRVDNLESALTKDAGTGEYNGPILSTENLQAFIVNNINMGGPGSNVRARVDIEDTSGTNIEDALIFGTWTLPDQSTVDVSGLTEGDGQFDFLIPEQPGVTAFEVTAVVKAGYVLNKKLSELRDERAA